MPKRRSTHSLRDLEKEVDNISFVGNLRRVANKPIPEPVKRAANSKPVQAVARFGKGVSDYLEPLERVTTRKTIGQAVESAAIAGMNRRERANFKPIAIRGKNRAEQLKDVGMGTATTALTALGSGTPAGLKALLALEAFDSATSVPYNMGLDLGTKIAGGSTGGYNTKKAVRGVAERLPLNVPRAGLYGPISNPIADKIGTKLGASRLGKTTITGVGNVAEDYITAPLQITDMPNAVTNVQSFLTPFLVDRITGKEVVDAVKGLDQRGEAGIPQNKTIRDIGDAKGADADVQGVKLGDLRAYEDALNKGDVDALAKLSQLHPEDKRFQVHKSFPNLVKSVETKARGSNSLGDVLKDQSGKAELGAEVKMPDSPVEKTPDIAPQKVQELERGFITTLKESPNAPDALKAELESTYRVKTNEQTINRALESLRKDYLGSYNKIISGKEKYTPESVAKAHILITELSQAGEYKAAANVAEAVAKAGTEAGQTVQAFSIWNKMTPEGMLVFAQKEIDAANNNRNFVDRLFRRKDLTLSPEASREILSIMQKAQELPSSERGEFAKRAMEIINREIPPSASELFDKYRYENMLSNPKTQMRNIFGNAFQTWVTRPATMAFETPYDWMRSTLFGTERQRYISDVPRYYKDALNAIPLGAEAFKVAFGGEAVIEQPDLRSMRRAGGWPVSRFMEGADKFNQTIIGSAVKADLMSKGASEIEARAEAERIAKYSLFRQQADPSNKTGQGYVLSAIDGFSSKVASFPGRKWMVPFIQTPTNVAKQWVEYSPAGLATIPGNTRPTEQLSKTTLGTIIMLIGAKLAAEGKTTWAPPTDPKEKQYYYETRKPFSVYIGDRWVPMQYFGPFALALALPAAYEYFDKVEKNALSTTQAQKAYNTVLQSFQFLTDQTFFTGLNNYIQFLSGDPDYNFESSLGFSATQVVPYAGFLKYLSTIIDPTMRKNKKFMDSFYQTIPGLSERNYPYLDPTGQPVQREPINYFIPYDVKTPDVRYEPAYQYSVFENQAGVFTNYTNRVRSILRDPTLSSQEKRDRVNAEAEKINNAYRNLYERNQQ